MGEKLLTTFSRALLISISLDISASYRPDTKKDPADPNFSDDKPDPRFHYLRDKHYMRLIATRANSSDWMRLIEGDGHLGV